MAGAARAAGHRSWFAVAMQVCLAPSVHAVSIGDDLVFLDVRRDRYLCWPGRPDVPVRVSSDGRTLEGVDGAFVAELLAAGLTWAGPTGSAFVAPVRLPPPRRDLDSFVSSPNAWRDGPDALRCAFDSAVTYRRRTFADLVAFAARRHGPYQDEAPAPRMLALVRSFHALAPWLPAPAKCLIRAFTLLRLLRRRGFDARWVFAVRTWPFEAHCWLQAGDVVLDDSCERLVAFHPILVV